MAGHAGLLDQVGRPYVQPLVTPEKAWFDLTDQANDGPRGLRHMAVSSARQGEGAAAQGSLFGRNISHAALP